jgi:hypothetical protein
MKTGCGSGIIKKIFDRAFDGFAALGRIQVRKTNLTPLLIELSGTPRPWLTKGIDRREDKDEFHRA